MINKIDILNNFLVSDKRDPAIQISNSNKIMKPITNLVNMDSYLDFISTQNSSLTLKLNKDTINAISTSINKASDLKHEILEILNKYEIFLSSQKIENIKKSVLEKTKISDLLIKEYNNSLKTINSLYKEAIKKRKEEAIWLLNLCHFFLKGTLSNGSTIKAPLILIPIEIKFIEGKLCIYKINHPIYNEKLNLLIEDSYGIKLNDLFLEKFKENNNLSVNQILMIYEQYLSALNINFSCQKIKKFTFETTDNLQKIKKLEVDFSCCISLVDTTGGKLKKDAIEIISRNENPFKTYSILKNNDEQIEDIINFDNIIELNGNLNLYQKIAINSSLKENCIINGPPGTGKSEVIANIVLNILNNNQTCLIVSEKKAALDVLHNRLQNINNLCLSAYDLNDPTTFYEKINNFHKLLLQSKTPSKINCCLKSYEIFKQCFLNLNNLNAIQIHDYKYDDIVKYLNMNLKSNNEINDIIVEFNKIITENDLTIKKSFKLLSDLKVFGNANKHIISLFINNKFKYFDISDIKKMIKKNSIKENDFLIWNYINKQSLNALNIFKKDYLKLPVSNNEIITFLNELANFNIKRINAYILAKICSINIDEDLYIYEIIKNNISFYYQKINDNLLQHEFDKYLNDKIQSSQNNDLIILQNYLDKFQNLYKSMSICEKEDIDNLFAQAKMNNKLSINLFATENFEKLKLIFPVWLLTPSNAAIILPNKQNVFNYGIFDEASQIFLERAFSIAYRSNINIISGDDKQLKPTNFFSSRYEIENNMSIDNVESLLERAKLSLWPTYYLKNHYRSDTGDLISFSSKNFYDDNLEFISKNGSFDDSINVIDINGIWENETNILECKKVLELIETHFNEYKSLMIITLNKKQCDLIEKEFIKMFSANNEIMQKYENDLITFNNLENIQGHEADLIILSIGYGFNKELKLLNSFGPLTQKNGSNRLNVAITRAKSKMIIVKSFKKSDMKINFENKDAYIFYQYISFIDKIKQKKNQIENSTESKVNNSYKNNVIEFIKNIINHYEHLSIVFNLQLGSCNIDFGVYSKTNNKIVLAINFDKTFVKNDLLKTLENLYRSKFIKDRGYNIIDINEIEWYFKNQKIMNRLNQELSKITENI